MFPVTVAERLVQLGHDALSVHDPRLERASDEDLFSFAVSDSRVIVTENFQDFARIVDRHFSEGQPCVPVLFVRKSRFPAGGALPPHLAAELDEWAREHPEPHAGIHWL